MKDIDRVIEILDDVGAECLIAARYGNDLTHTRVVHIERRIEEAVMILQEWPAKVYAVGVEHEHDAVPAAREASEGGG